VRILLAGQSYDRPGVQGVNGPGVFARRLAEAFAAAGHRILALVPSERGLGYAVEVSGVAIRALAALPLAPRRGVSVAAAPGRAIARILERFRPEVVHLQDHYPLCRSTLRAARRRGLPVIATNHFLPGSMLRQLPALGPAEHLAARALWALVLSVLERARLATAPTRTAARLLAERGLRTRIEAVSCGVDLHRFTPEPENDRGAVRRRFGLDPGATVALYVGRLDRDKSVDVLVRAMARPAGAGIQLVLAGEGADRARLGTLAARLGVSRAVVFAGRVPDPDLAPLFRAADLFAMPGELELQSIATLEAMASGRPVAAANACALPELVEDGRTGLLFRPGDPDDAARCLARLGRDPGLRSEMGRRARARAEDHDLAGTLGRFEELYASLATGAARP
jgi:1,2-diacylglycerol 3-alpha-glucosyltransferase